MTTSTAPWPVQEQRWRSTTGLRTALTWLLGFDAIVAAASAAGFAHRVVVTGAYERGTASVGDVHHAGDAISTIAGIGALPSLATVVVFIIWQWRSANNANALGTLRPRYTPGWSIAGWFIPVANLVIPVRVMQDLWQSADPDAHDHADWRTLPRSSLVGGWWTAFLLSTVLDLNITGNVSTSELRLLDGVHMTGHGVRFVAALLTVLVVRHITERQAAAHERIPIDAGASAPGGWYSDPTARFDYRYWNGEAWTDHVSRAGQAATDPLMASERLERWDSPRPST
jgi:hypothetical protein